MALIFLALPLIGQSTKLITVKSIENELRDFLIEKGDIDKNKIEDFNSGKLGLIVIGLINGSVKEELLDGFYSFSLLQSHTRVYFLIIEKENYTILDLSSRDGLETSIKNTLDFCERNKYCSDLSKEYISRMITMYYKVNKNPIHKIDINCETKIRVKKSKRLQ